MSENIQEQLIGSIVKNLLLFSADFCREAEDCKYYGKIYDNGCHNPGNPNNTCQWQTCPLGKE